MVDRRDDVPRGEFGRGVGLPSESEATDHIPNCGPAFDRLEREFPRRLDAVHETRSLAFVRDHRPPFVIAMLQQPEGHRKYTASRESQLIADFNSQT